MTTEHTPGPWTRTPTKIQTAGFSTELLHRQGDGDRGVAWLIPGHPTARADAQLLEAAPELLEALERAVEMLNCATATPGHMAQRDHSNCGYCAALTNGRAAITKARQGTT